jgi:hypothetical protein
MYFLIHLRGDSVVSSQMFRSRLGFEMVKSHAVPLLAEMVNIDAPGKFSIGSDIDLAMGQDSSFGYIPAGVSEFVDLSLPDTAKRDEASVFFNAIGDSSIPVSDKKSIWLTSEFSSLVIGQLRESDVATASAGAEREFSNPLRAWLSRSVPSEIVQGLSFGLTSLGVGLGSKIRLGSTAALAKSTRIAHWVASRIEVALRGCCASTQWPHFSINTGGDL